MSCASSNQGERCKFWAGITMAERLLVDRGAWHTRSTDYASEHGRVHRRVHIGVLRPAAAGIEIASPTHDKNPIQLPGSAAKAGESNPGVIGWNRGTCTAAATPVERRLDARCAQLRRMGTGVRQQGRRTLTALCYVRSGPRPCATIGASGTGFAHMER